MNEGYFTLTGANASADFGGQTPFETGQGNAYARILHETSNSYGFPYADSNLKVLVQADPTAPLILTIIRDDEARDFDDTPTANQPQFGDYQFGIGGGSESLGIITIGGWRYLPNAAGAYGGFLPTVTDWTQMNFSGPGQHIWFKTTGAGAVAADGCFSGAAPAFNNAKTLIWGANVSWVAGHDSPPKPVS